MSRYPTEAKLVATRGLAGSTRVRFVGTIPHGKTARQVAIDVHPELIVQIATALVATRDCACDSAEQRERRHHSEFGWQCGHAIWHVEHPDRPMPCISGKVIELPTEDLEVRDMDTSKSRAAKRL